MRSPHSAHRVRPFCLLQASRLLRALMQHLFLSPFAPLQGEVLMSHPARSRAAGPALKGLRALCVPLLFSRAYRYLLACLSSNFLRSVGQRTRCESRHDTACNRSPARVKSYILVRIATKFLYAECNASQELCAIAVEPLLPLYILHLFGTAPSRRPDNAQNCI